MGLLCLLKLENVKASANVIVNIKVLAMELFGINSDINNKVIIQMEEVK